MVHFPDPLVYFGYDLRGDSDGHVFFFFFSPKVNSNSKDLAILRYFIVVEMKLLEGGK